MAKKKELDMKAGMQYEDMPLASLRPIKFKKAPKKPVKKSIITSEPPTHKMPRDLNVKETPKRGRPKEITRTVTKSSQAGLRDGLTRATFIIREDTLDRLKERAYTDRKKLKDLVSEALDYYLDNNKDGLKVVVLYHIPLIIGVWLSGWFAHSQDNKKFESLLCLVLALVVTNILEKNAYGKYKRGR